MGTAMAKTGKLPPVESAVPKSPSASLRNTTSPVLRQSALKRESCCRHALARGASPVPARQRKPCESSPAITTSLAHAAVHTSCAMVANSGSISGSSVRLISVSVSDVISDVTCGIVPLYRILWYSESDAPGWRLRPYAGDSTTYSIHFDDAATTYVKLSGFLRRSRLVSLLVQIYKEINAPFGELSENTLKVSTFAITSDSAGDLTYTALENVISSWT